MKISRFNLLGYHTLLDPAGIKAVVVGRVHDTFRSHASWAGDVAGLESPNSEDLRSLFIREYKGSPGSVPSNTHTHTEKKPDMLLFNRKYSVNLEQETRESSWR